MSTVARIEHNISADYNHQILIEIYYGKMVMVREDNCGKTRRITIEMGAAQGFAFGTRDNKSTSLNQNIFIAELQQSTFQVNEQYNNERKETKECKHLLQAIPLTPAPHPYKKELSRFGL